MKNIRRINHFEGETLFDRQPFIVDDLSEFKAVYLVKDELSLV